MHKIPSCAQISVIKPVLMLKLAFKLILRLKQANHLQMQEIAQFNLKSS